MFFDPKLMFLNEIPGEFKALSREPKTCAHMKFFDWNMCIRFLGVKKRRVALYTHCAFSIMVQISKWRILIFFEILMSPNIGILYIVGKSFSCWTTFLLQKSLKMYSMWVKGDRRCQNDVIIFQRFDTCFKLMERIFHADWLFCLRKGLKMY